jgi:hypothetical protein
VNGQLRGVKPNGFHQDGHGENAMWWLARFGVQFAGWAWRWRGRVKDIARGVWNWFRSPIVKALIGAEAKEIFATELLSNFKLIGAPPTDDKRVLVETLAQIGPDVLVDEVEQRSTKSLKNIPADEFRRIVLTNEDELKTLLVIAVGAALEVAAQAALLRRLFSSDERYLVIEKMIQESRAGKA